MAATVQFDSIIYFHHFCMYLLQNFGLQGYIYCLDVSTLRRVLLAASKIRYINKENSLVLISILIHKITKIMNLFWGMARICVGVGSPTIYEVIYIWIRVGELAICEHIYIWLRVGQLVICEHIYIWFNEHIYIWLRVGQPAIC